ncbi:3',5'-cyclic-nucleotide phosphodiesterase pde1 [Orbilia oligospora]|nr:3',5'-cyclic-nucleotide phosphodiesterase pde1 [Orbilia oligospora]
MCGAGGGPSEEGVTGFLVRSTATDWSPGSILAVDAGSHLASIIRILENTSSPQHPTTPTTPNSTRRRVSSIQHRDLTVNTNASNPPSHFQGCDLPFKTPRANAAHIFRELVGGYCITHPHLDHISGLVINTAGMLPHNAKKTIAALPPTIEALKLHVFNDIIWPNLSDENGGVGFLTYQRLVDASVVDGKIEYRKIVDGLSVQAWPVSHGHCMHKHTHRGSDAAMVATEDGGPQKCVFKPSTLRSATWQKKCVYDSSCFFIRDDYTSKEIMIFGDVEPDSVSISEPRRNVYIWNYAAEKVHSGVLEAIFIESSYDIHQKDEFLYGHLTPRHIVEELQVLASKVLLQKEREARRYSMPKRRRTNNGYAERSQSLLQIDPFDAEFLQPLSQYNSDGESDVPRSPTDVEGLTTASNIGIQRRSSGGKRRREDDDDDQPEYTSVPTQNVSPISMVSNAGGPVDTALPLKGLKIVIIHIKDDFDDDKDVRQSILANLKRLGEKAGLGCEFELAETGGSMFF